MRFSMVFTNYSDDGQLFIDGDLTYQIGETIVATDNLNLLTGTDGGSVGLDLTVSGGQASGERFPSTSGRQRVMAMEEAVRTSAKTRSFSGYDRRPRHRNLQPQRLRRTQIRLPRRER